MQKRVIYGVIAAAAVAAGVGLSFVKVAAQPGGAVPIDADDIGGVVTSSRGPEAGVWVIAQTGDLPTKFIRIVVTDDRGRYVVPDLPAANYDVWVRGYGLVDSPKVRATRGKTLNLMAVPAPTPKAAADYYPANYWYSLLQPPPATDFPGTGRAGNGYPETVKTQAHWIAQAKMNLGCTQCHQMGTRVTREMSVGFRAQFKNSVEAWDHRIQMGISGAYMSSSLGPIGRKSLEAFANWSDRIAAGELPPVPPRPAGLERNIVVTQWEWATNKTFVHDEIATDRRNPTLNAYGPVLGVEELSGDWISLLDPVKHRSWRLPLTVPNQESLPYAWAQDMPQPSPYWGEEIIWKGKLAPHNPMGDHKGRLWVTARHGCHVYDPKTDRTTHVPECRLGGHLQISDDDVFWAGANYFDVRKYDAGDAKGAAGRVDPVVDFNGNGKADFPGTNASEAPDPARDWAVAAGGYSTIVNPADGTVWYSRLGTPGSITRLDPKTKILEIYEPPFNNPKSKVSGYLPHGIDVDRSNGVIWVGLNSGHYAAFDRRKCAGPLNGPAATGQHCPEGWMLHQAPGPKFKTVEWPGSADSYYLNWVDWHNTGGFGNNVPMLVGSGSDSLMALVDGKWVVMRVPYPLGFMARGMDGRIDDPKAGWKGRGLWATHSEQPTWHQEGGVSERPKVAQFQLRPNPLAK
ncbi:MAG: carboxypeptidase regulatory-like domain-containing protein [Vicinamibacterales bacterium]